MVSTEDEALNLASEEVKGRCAHCTNLELCWLFLICFERSGLGLQLSSCLYVLSSSMTTPISERFVRIAEAIHFKKYGLRFESFYSVKLFNF